MIAPHYPDLAGKTVLVTGASQGLGLAIATAFAGAGCRTAAFSRSPFPSEAVSPQAPHPVHVIRGDILDLTSIQEWLNALEESGRGVDVLVNNAGVYLKRPLADTSAEDFEHVFGVNVRALIVLSRMCAAQMKGRSGGVIINAASYAATLPSVGHGLYAASKAAVVSLTRSMAAEWAPYGIRVNAYSVGVVPTQMTRPALEARAADLMDDISLRRVGTPEEVANVVLFLASDSSSYVTGANIDVSGGKLVVQRPGQAWSP